MELLWWIWALLVLLFVVAEIFTTGFFLFCFGVGAAAAGIVAWLGYDLTAQLAVFVVVSGLMVAAVRPLAWGVGRKARNTVGIDRVLHKPAVVTSAIEPTIAKGRVRVEREEWLADSVTGKAIPAGTAVEVIAVEGTRLQVRPLQSQAPATVVWKDFVLEEKQ
jgi:membrane protein implicated in regulation of membrane protease activity